MMREPGKPAVADGYHHGDLRRALIGAALALVTEEQNWAFSLREVARRAGVSHNAPYNHFADKRELLAAVAAAGYDALHNKILASFSADNPPDKALIKSGVAYVKFGLENPAHYRLMFSSELSGAGSRPDAVLEAADRTRSVLESILRRGAHQGVFVSTMKREEELQAAVLTAWSSVHGLTMLALDRLPAIPRKSLDHLAEKLSRIVCQGMMRR